MRSFFSAALFIAGLFALRIPSGVALGRYVLFILLVFVVLSIVVSLVAFLLFIFTVPMRTSHKE